MFYNALPNHIQGRARAMSVVVVIPLALLVSGGTLWAVQRLDPVYFLGIGLCGTLLYLLFNMRMNKAYVNEILTHLRNRLFIPNQDQETALKEGGASVLQELQHGVLQDDDQISTTYARVLARSFPQEAVPTLLQRIHGSSNDTRNQLIEILIPLKPDKLGDFLWAEYESADVHLKSTIMKALIKLGDARTQAQVDALLQDSNPRLKALAVSYRLVTDADDHAYELFNEMLRSSEIGEVFSALETLQEFDEYGLSDNLDKIDSSVFQALITHEDKRLSTLAIQSLALWPQGAMPALKQALPQRYRQDDHKVRVAPEVLVER